MKTEIGEEMVVGASYWLDNVKDLAGTFMGLDENGRYVYTDVPVTNGWYLVEDGMVKFSSPPYSLSL